MTTLADNLPRKYLLGDFDDLDMVDADIIYEGAAVGDNGSGLARPLVAADPFLGFASRKADNAAGAAGAKNVNVRARGTTRLTVVGASSDADIGEDVYASDDNTFTLTASGSSVIGTVVNWITSTTCDVYFESVSRRSI